MDGSRPRSGPRPAMRSIARHALRCRRCSLPVTGNRLALQSSLFRDGDDSAGVCVPEDAFQRLGNVRQPQASDIREQMLVSVVALNQAIIRNFGKQMMNVVVANIGGEPV